MQIKCVYGEGFMTLGKFSLNLAGRGITAVHGENLDSMAANSNGAGKSAVFEALAWCLYGKTARGMGPDDVVSRSLGKCEVAVKIEDDGQEYVITRTRAKKSGALSVTANGADISNGSMGNTQEVIDTIMGMDWNTYCGAVYFGQGALLPWPSLGDKAVKGVFESALQLEEFTILAGKAKDKNKDMLDAMKEAVFKREQCLQNAKNLLELADKATANAVKWDGDRQTRLDTLKQEEAEIYAEIEREEAEITPRKIDLNRLSKLKDDLLEASWAKQRMEEAVQKARELEAEINTADFARGHKADKREELLRAISDAESFMNQPCPTCGRKMGKVEVARLVGNDREKAETLGSELITLDSVLKEVRARVKELRDYAAQETKGAAAMPELEAEIAAIEANQRANEQAQERAQGAKERLKTRLLSKRAQIKATMAEENPWLPQVSDHRTKAAGFIKDAEAHKKTESVAERKAMAAKYLMDAYGPAGIPSYMLDNVTPDLNQAAAHYSNLLTGGAVTIEFSTTKRLKSGEIREKFAVTASDDNGADAYKPMSGGEKRRVDLACSLAFRRLVASRATKGVNLLIMDEVFDALDATGQERVIELIDAELVDGKVFVITHNPDLAAHFPDYIKVRRQNGISALEV